MKIKLNEVEKQIILKHDPACRARALMELEIVSAIIRQADRYGYYFDVEGENTETDNKLKQVLFNLDDALLVVYDSQGNMLGWIKLVLGNDGYDLISDYSTNLTEFLTPINKLAEFWGG